MFVEQLSCDQVQKFLWQALKEDVCYPEFGFHQIEIQKTREDWCWYVNYISKTYGRLSIWLLDDLISPLMNRGFEKAWIRYLYSIFGEEYKKWYMSKKEKMFY